MRLRAVYMEIRRLFDYSQPLVAAATICGAALIAVACIGGATAYRIKNAGDLVSVTGSARETVTSDYARLVIAIETRTDIHEQERGFALLESAVTRIAANLEKDDFTDVELPPASSNPQYYYPERSAPVMTGYTISRSVIVRSDDVSRMHALANEVGRFSGNGYTVSIGGLELTYRKLDAIRVALLEKAFADAKARADAIARQSGRSVGALRSSSSGVVQVLAKGGVDVSDYGTYDTQSVEKEIMVTVRAAFSLD